MVTKMLVSARTGLYFVKEGRVHLYQLNHEGKQFTLDILSEGNIFGEMGGISLGTRGLFIETIEESDICVMDKERFESYLIQRPRFMMNIMKAMSERLSYISSLIQNLAIGKLHDKIIYSRNTMMVCFLTNYNVRRGFLLFFIGEVFHE